MKAYLNRVCLAVLLLVYLAPFAQAGSSQPSERPNIIFFLVDDYDKPETSVYGGRALTPNLDRLAREGMTFHRAHMTSTVCTPSRYTCLTGRYEGSSYSSVYLEECPLGKQGLPAFNVALEDDNMNVGQVLSDNGYVTGFVGKYHVGLEESHLKHFTPIAKNAEYSDEINRQQYANEKHYRQLVLDRGFDFAKNIYWGNMKSVFRGHNPQWTIDAAVEFIEQNRDRPFYLHYCTTLLHGPNGEWYKSLTEKDRVTGEGIIDKPLTSMPPRKTVMQRVREAGLTENEAGFTWMDDSIGTLLDKLDELGIAENTIFVFLADHGSLRKGSLYSKDGTEVPCIIRWPKGIAKGTECDELIQNTDFVPTWFDLAGVKLPKQYRIDGISLAPLFRNPDQPIRNYVYNEMGPGRSIKTKEWTYIALRYTSDQVEMVQSRPRATKQMLGLSGGVSRGYTNPHAFCCDQLYDIQADPEETRNLAGRPKCRSTLAEMKQLLTQELKRFPNRPFGELIPGGNALPAGSFDHTLQTVSDAAKEKK